MFDISVKLGLFPHEGNTGVKKDVWRTSTDIPGDLGIQGELIPPYTGN